MKTKMLYKIFSVLAALLILSVSVGFVLADGEAGKSGTGGTVSFPDPLRCPKTDEPCLSWFLNKVLSRLNEILIPIVALMILIGGFQMLFSQGNPETFKKGQKTILYAVVGYAVILLFQGVAYIISSIVYP